MTASTLLFFVSGCALGAGLDWLVLRARAAAQLQVTESRAVAAEARADTLERLGSFQQTLTDDFDGRQKAIEELVRPLSEQLAGYREQTAELERTRLGDLGQVKDHLTRLTDHTQQIAGALRSTHTRGRWGEITLRRTAELAGLSAHCDFSEQVGSEGGKLRPDMRVHLPGGREIVIDAKVPLDGYLKALEAADDAGRANAMREHAAFLRRHVDALAGREYQSRLSGSHDFVVLFLPHDALLGSACEHDRTLTEHALRKDVVFATPTTLFALLKAVANGWREEQLAKNAEEIVSLAEVMQERLVTFADHFQRLGGSLGKAVDTFNKALGSLETRVLPTSRRIRELGASRSKPLPEIAAIDVQPREPRRPELSS
jgi:DNA recombination protein RmuC